MHPEIIRADILHFWCTSDDVIGLLKITSGQFHQTIVMITHNPDIAARADRVVRIEDGKIV